MKPLAEGLAARLAAVEVVGRALAGEYLAPTLSEVLDASTLEGRDRSLATELSYGAVRRLSQLDAALAPFLKAPNKLPPRVLLALRLGAYELLQRGTPAYAAVSAWVEIVKRDTPSLVGLANAVLRRVGRAAEAGRHLSTFDDHALPPWLLERFVTALGEDAARRAAAGMLNSEPFWLTAFSAEAVEVLEADGCDVTPGPELVNLAPGADDHAPGVGPPGLDRPRSLAIRSPLPLARLEAYRRGLVQPQNPSSLYVATLLTDAARAGPPEERVIDLASGHGVKAAVLAASGARVVAVERSAKRSRAAATNLRRLGLEVEHVVADLTGTPLDELLGSVGGEAAKVLLDAPCSGTGTLRGNPEIKLRLTQGDVAALAVTQAAMLDTAAALVSPGGRLVYAVCSLTPEEGPDQIQAFLERHEGYTARDPTPPLPHVSGPVGCFILPVDGLDGFFISILERQ